MKTCPCTEPYRPEGTCPDCGHAWARHATPEGCTALVPGEAESGPTCPRPDCRSPRSCTHPLAAGSEPCAPTTPLFGTPEVVDFHQLLGDDDSQAWAIQRQLKEQLGRPYLATQLAAALPNDVAMRLVQRIEELTGPEIERRLGQHIADLQADIDNVTAATLVRLAEAADAKRKELTRERFAGGSRLS